MSDIRMIEVFVMPVSDRNNRGFTIEETEAATIAINAYDDNQEKIAQLEADLKQAKDNLALTRIGYERKLKVMVDKHNAKVDEVAALKEVIESLRKRPQYDVIDLDGGETVKLAME